jgi:hypothetical protein
MFNGKKCQSKAYLLKFKVPKGTEADIQLTPPRVTANWVLKG